MKRRMSYFSIIILITGGFVLSSCDKSPTASDSETATAKNQEAYTELENQLSGSGSLDTKDFTKAEQLYTEAVTADPSNATANFGAAFAKVLNVNGDAQVKDMMNRWKAWDPGFQSPLLKFGIPKGTADMNLPITSLGKNLVKIFKVATTDPPTITEMQAVIRDRILPRIDYAIARLAIVEQHPEFELKITGKMQGSPGQKDLYLDLTEVYVMDAALQGIKASIEQFLVFKFTLSAYTTKAAVAAIKQDNPDFFVLASDGAAHAQNIKTSLVNAVGKIRSGINFLKNETDNQDDDIIKRGSGGVAVKDLDTVLTYLTKVESALNGTYSIDLKDADSDNNDYTIQVSLSNFFGNLPQNPKQAWFPTYTVDTTSGGDIQWHWFATDYASFTFPDPTFSGLFPGMSNETLKRLMYIDEEFAWNLSVNVTDDNGALPSNASLKIVVNGKTYASKPDNSGYYSQYSQNCRFLIMDNDSKPVQQIAAVINGIETPLQFNGTIPTVHLKSHDYGSADITVAPQNITASYSPNSIFVNLARYANYRIERSVSSGSFVEVSSGYTSGYNDTNLSGNTNYSYRAMRLSSSFFYYGYTASRLNNYTNVVSLKTP